MQFACIHGVLFDICIKFVDYNCLHRREEMSYKECEHEYCIKYDQTVMLALTLLRLKQLFRAFRFTVCSTNQDYLKDVCKWHIKVVTMIPA